MADERTYKMLLGAIAGGGSGGANGLCILTDNTLDKSYNDLLGMVNSGIIPFVYRNGYLWLLSALDIDGDGIAFKENSQAGSSLLFNAPDGDPDANLLLD